MHLESEVTPQKERGMGAGDEEEDRPGFRSGQTGKRGRHREARGPSRRVPVIREKGQEGRRVHSFSPLEGTTVS